MKEWNVFSPSGYCLGTVKARTKRKAQRRAEKRFGMLVVVDLCRDCPSVPHQPTKRELDVLGERAYGKTH